MSFSGSNVRGGEEMERTHKELSTVSIDESYTYSADTRSLLILT